MDIPEYRIIRSRRKTLGVQIDENGVTVRAPLGATEGQIREFLQRHARWIGQHLQKREARQRQLAAIPRLTEAELQALTERARPVFAARVRHFAPLVGVEYGRITVRSQHTRWGSCSAKGNLNFNCLLLLAPPEVLDSVVVHELCHRLEMNHSRRFYAEVLRVFPDYRKWDGWLKQNGAALLHRLPEKTE